MFALCANGSGSARGVCLRNKLTTFGLSVNKFERRVGREVVSNNAAVVNGMSHMNK